MKTEQVKIKFEHIPYDIPMTFICGKYMMEKIGIIEPDVGIVFYLFKESEVGEHGTDWLPDIPESCRICAVCLPDSVTYESYIKRVYKSLEDEKPVTWNYKVLSGIIPDLEINYGL